LFRRAFRIEIPFYAHSKVPEWLFSAVGGFRFRMPVVDTALKIALLGPPGSGKGSQCVRIKERYPDLCYINPQMMLRDEIHRQTPQGVAAQSKIVNGEIIDSSVYTQLMLDRARSQACKAGYILDGVPIDVKQAEAFVQQGEELDAVIFLDVDDETVIRRTSGRWVHQRSGRIYHDTFARPKAYGFDDETGEKLQQRADDTPVVAHARLDTFKANALALREFYCTSADMYAAARAEVNKAAKKAAKEAAKAARNATQQLHQQLEHPPQGDAAAGPVTGDNNTVTASTATTTTTTKASPASGVASIAAEKEQAPAASPPAAAAEDSVQGYLVTRFQKRLPTIATVDANGGLETVRTRIFKAIDEAITAKKDRIAKAKWFGIW
jgi:adenylate kinase